MKKLLIIFTVITGYARAQVPTIDPNTCMNQQNLYTGTTNPADQSTYTFGYTNLNPNGVNGPAHFDWVNTVNLSCYTSVNQFGVVNNSPSTLLSPFYCNGGNGYNGGCDDNNTALYNDIKSDPLNLYGGSTAAKLKAMDILPEDGWELLKYSFGRPPDPNIANDPGVPCYNPFIWLYNRYTGKMKLFVAITNVNLPTGANPSAAVIKFTTDPIGKYDLVANARPFTHILSDFNHNTDINAVSNCDMIGLNAANSGLQYYWLYAECMTSYDPCVCRQANANITKLHFDVILTQVSNVNLTQSGTSVPIYSTSTSMNYNPNAAGSYKADDNASTAVNTPLITGAKEMIQGYKDWNEYADLLRGLYNAQTSNGTVPSTNPVIINITNSIAGMLSMGGASASVKTATTYDFLNGTNATGNNPNPKSAPEAIQFILDMSPLIEAVASEYPFVGAFLSLINYMADGGSKDETSAAKPAAPPTAYILNSKISGSISQQNVLNVGNVYVPGEYLNKDMNLSGQKNADGIYPIYNNPLGVLNIVDVPNFEYKTIPMTNNGVDLNDFNLNYGYIKGKTFDGSSNQGGNLYPFANVFNYRLSGPVKYTINPAANLTLKSMDACIVLEYDGTDPLYLKHGSVLVTSPNDVSGSNPAGWTGTSFGNNNQKQVPYYKNMHVEFDPWNNALSDKYVYSDDLSTVLAGIPTTGLDVEYKSDNFTSANGTNATGEVIRFRTHYVPLQSLQSIDFVLLGSQNVSQKPLKVYLKLFGKLQKNNDPNAAPVTFLLTYDISDKMASAQNAGTGGFGSFNYYFIKDKGSPFNWQKPGDYATFSNLSLQGAYWSPNYGATGPVNISASTNGALSTTDINIANNTNLIPNSTGWLTYSAVQDVNIGDNVKIQTTTSSPQIVSVRAGRNMTIGKGFFTSTYGSTSNQATFYAGNDLTINDSYNLGDGAYSNLSMYAAHNIILNHNSNYTNIYTGNTKPFILNARLYARNEIIINTGSGLNEAVIQGESVLNTNQQIPNAWAMLHNDDGSTPLTSLQASNADIAAICGSVSINNRTAHITDTTIAAKQPAKAPEYKIGIYPNPTTGHLSVNLFTPESADLSITVENITGELLLQQNLNVGKGFSQNQLNIENFINGLYIIKVSDLKNGNVIKIQKIILNK